jgi:hypothetical protein
MKRPSKKTFKKKKNKLCFQKDYNLRIENRIMSRPSKRKVIKQKERKRKKRGGEREREKNKTIAEEQ